MKKIKKQMTIEDLKKEKQVGKRKATNHSQIKKGSNMVNNKEQTPFLKRPLGKCLIYLLLILVIIVLSMLVNQNRADGFFVMLGVIILIYALVSTVIFLRK